MNSFSRTSASDPLLPRGEWQEPAAAHTVPHAIVGKVYDEPSEVFAEAGVVVVDGPDGVAVTLTPRSAKETGKRLEAGAEEAEGQKRTREAD